VSPGVNPLTDAVSDVVKAESSPYMSVQVPATFHYMLYESIVAPPVSDPVNAVIDISIAVIDYDIRVGETGAFGYVSIVAPTVFYSE
jgi:hypothetical protein